MDSFLVYHVNVIYVAEMCRTCVYVRNKKVIKFKQYDQNWWNYTQLMLNA